MNNEYFQQLLQSIQDSDLSHEHTFYKELIVFGDPIQPFTSGDVAEFYLEDLLTIIVLAYSEGYYSRMLIICHYNTIQKLNSTLFELQSNVWLGLLGINYSIIDDTPVTEVTL